jgi:hypothetical protein
MTAVIKVNVDDLDDSFLKDIKAQYAHSTLEIHVHKDPEATFTEASFWRLVDLLDWDKDGDDEAVIAPLVNHLAEAPLAHIYRFHDLLSEMLWKLDTKQHAQPFLDDPEEDGYLSVDDFLYVRCAVVANGQAYYDNILRSPDEMPTHITFESLLYVASEAYEKQTGKPLTTPPTYNYETYSNKKGWE